MNTESTMTGEARERPRDFVVLGPLVRFLVL